MFGLESGGSVQAMALDFVTNVLHNLVRMRHRPALAA